MAAPINVFFPEVVFPYDHLVYISYAEETQTSPLFFAVRTGNIEVVKTLLDEGFEVNIAENHITPLLYAFNKLYHAHYYGTLEVKKEWEGIILLLLKHPDINVNSGLGLEVAGSIYDEIIGKTPLYLAVESASFTIFDLLINHPKITINQFLHISLLQKIIELYHQDMSYLEPFLQNPSGKIYEDALFHAVHYANIKAFKLLLKVTNINHENENGITVLIKSAVYNSIEMTKILLSDEKTIVDFVNKHGLTALHFAIYYGYLEIVELLTSKFGIKLNAGIVSPLVLAVIKDRTDIVKKLLEFGNLKTWATQPEFKAITHTSLLAIKDMQPSISSLVMKKIIGFLIPSSSTSESKTDLTLNFNLFDDGNMAFLVNIPKGSTALSIAVTHGNIEIVNLLLHAQEWDQVVLNDLLNLIEPEVIKKNNDFITIKELLNNELNFLKRRKFNSGLVNYGSTPKPDQRFVNNDEREDPPPKRR